MLNSLKTLIKRGIIETTARLWNPYSRLFLLSDAPFWVIAREIKELRSIAEQLGIRFGPRSIVDLAEKQSVFLGSHFDLFLQDKWFKSSHRLGAAYFHGLPGTGVAEFDESYEKLGRFHEKISRIQVSHSELQNLVLESGIDEEKVFLIPIGINLQYFQLQTEESRRKNRDKYGIPQSSVVIGSFQKDGVGWEDGFEPKKIKGPDIFLSVVRLLKEKVPELFVLLGGPARGYVKKGLEGMGIQYRHCFLKDYADIGGLYHALDLYLVSSRQEGGPKAILESMATGIPLVTTRVGQAMDLVKHGQNGWMADVEDVEGLVHCCEKTLSSGAEKSVIREAGRKVAEANSYESQLPLWERFYDGFVSRRTS